MGIRSTGAWALCALLLATAAAPAKAALEVPGQEVVFTWSHAQGPVAGYYVFVSINGAPLTLDHATSSNQSLPIAGVPGDLIQIVVRAFDDADNVGPFSQPSETIVLAIATPPGGDPTDPPGEDPPGEDPPGEAPPNPGLSGREISSALNLDVEDKEPFRSTQSKVKVRLLDMEGLGAKATVKFKLNQKRAKFVLKAKRLEPNTEYELRLDGVTQAMGVTNKKGKLKFKLKTNQNGNRLWFDPRGSVLSLHDSQGEVLSAMVSGPGEPAASKVKERARIQEDQDGGQLWSWFDSKGGNRSFRLRANGIPEGRYDVLLDGVAVGTMDVGAGGAGSASFSGAALDFDPRGGLLQLARGGETWFSGDVEAQLPGFTICDGDAVTFPLLPAGTAGGTVEADLEVDEDCTLRLRLRLANVPGGSYQLFVGGESIGTLQASSGNGMLELESVPRQQGVIPLPFDPRGEAIELELGGAVQFTD